MRLGRASAYGVLAMMDIAGANSPSSHHRKLSASSRNAHGQGNGHTHSLKPRVGEPPLCAQAHRIAESTGIPVEYLRKVLQRLSRARLVQSERGRSGGFRLGKSPQKITLLDIIEAIEGPVDEVAFLGDSLLRGKVCKAHPRLRQWRKEASEGLRDLLQATSLEDLMS